jgi:hypothetical protein
MMRLRQIPNSVESLNAELTLIEDANFEQYLQDKLGHLTQKERSVMEPVLRKYRHIFHAEGSNDFKGRLDRTE